MRHQSQYGKLFLQNREGGCFYPAEIERRGPSGQEGPEETHKEEVSCRLSDFSYQSLK
jgi:hypothetical protein